MISTRPSDPVMVQYTGTLIADAEARSQVLPTGHTVPALCLFVELDIPTANIMHVEQPFAEGEFVACHAAARRLKKHTQVTVQAPLRGTRIVARNAAHIHVINPTEQTTP